MVKHLQKIIYVLLITLVAFASSHYGISSFYKSKEKSKGLAICNQVEQIRSSIYIMKMMNEPFSCMDDLVKAKVLTVIPSIGNQFGSSYFWKIKLDNNKNQMKLWLSVSEDGVITEDVCKHINKSLPKADCSHGYNGYIYLDL